MAPQPEMSRRLAFLFAVAAGAAIANLYWAQPLLGFIADDLGAATATAGWLVTASQIGYAVGVLLLVPLGDVLDRRRFVPLMLLASAAALLLCALAPSIGVLLLALGVLGATTISGQVLTPLAGDLAGDAHRGRIVGVVGSGTLTGILASPASFPAYAAVASTTAVGRFRPPARRGHSPSAASSWRRSAAGPSYSSSSRSS
jgi:predicted MFS family arabinose efflux permease